MSTKAERGTKRTCRNPECGSRFYDLNRDPIVCPICQTVFELAPAPGAMAAAAPPAAAEAAAARPAARKPAYPVDEVKPDAAAVDADEDALPPIEDDEEAPAGEEDETFLEAEEEDGSDMTNIIGGPVAETDEPQ
jgi:uncharacterized protein (TIGR02300 family)